MKVGAHHNRRRLLLAGVTLWLLATAALVVRISRPADVESEPRPAAPLDERADRRGGSDSQAAETGSETAGPPSAFSHDEAGAAAAAVSFAGASQRWLYWTDDQIADAVEGIATPSTADWLRDEIVSDIRLAREELAQSSGRVWWLVHPLAWRVDDYDSEHATVAVWLMTLLSASDIAVPQTEWLTATMELDWVAGTWQLDAVRETPGPTPMTGPHDEPWQPEPFDDALVGFTRLDGETVVPDGQP